MLTIKCLFEQIMFELSTEFRVGVCEPERWWKTVHTQGPAAENAQSQFVSAQWWQLW